jgi:hypothetical protein
MNVEPEASVMAGWLGWRFKGQTPWWFTLVVVLIVVDSVAHFGLLMMVSSWAASTRDSAHAYPLPFRDGNVYFVSPIMGEFLNAWWLAPALFVVLAVLLVLKRDELVRE